MTRTNVVEPRNAAEKRLAKFVYPPDEEPFFSYGLSFGDLVPAFVCFFDPAPYPRKYERLAFPRGWQNAQWLADNHTELTYVEGYVAIGKGIHGHAWCVDAKSRVVDPTLETPGLAYYGIPFETDVLRGHLIESLVYENKYDPGPIMRPGIELPKRRRKLSERANGRGANTGKSVLTDPTSWGTHRVL